jgi:hypothetical protein
MAQFTVSKTCPYCGQECVIENVDLEKFLRWREGELIQNVWPEKDEEWRDALRIGMHASCQRSLYRCRICGDESGECECS